VASALLLLGALGFAAHAWRRAAQTERSLAAEREAHRLLYPIVLRAARPTWEQNDLDTLWELLDSQTPEKTGGEDLRGFEWYYWHRLLKPAGAFRVQTVPVGRMSLSPDSSRLAVLGGSAVQVLDAVTGRELFRLQEGTRSWRCAPVWSPDGRRLAVAAKQGVGLWDAATGLPVWTSPYPYLTTRAVALSPDGRSLAVAGAGVRLLSADTGAELFSLVGAELSALVGWEREVHGVAFSPDGGRLATCSEGGPVRIWGAATGRLLRSLTTQPLTVLEVAFSPDGRRLATRWREGRVEVWDADSGRQIFSLPQTAGYLDAFCWSPDGRLLATAGMDRVVRLWQADTGRELQVLKGHRDRVRGVAFHHGGGRLVSVSEDGEVRWWDVDRDPGVLTRTAPAGLRLLAFAPDGHQLAAAGDAGLHVWDRVSGRRVLHIEKEMHTVFAIAYSPDGRRLLGAVRGGPLRAWDAATGREISPQPGDPVSDGGNPHSPDGRRLARSTPDGSLKVYDTDTGQEVLTLNGPGETREIHWSSDGRCLAGTFDDFTVRVWDTAD
jgi:WD40 repeat protein